MLAWVQLEVRLSSMRFMIPHSFLPLSPFCWGISNFPVSVEGGRVGDGVGWDEKNLGEIFAWKSMSKNV